MVERELATAGQAIGAFELFTGRKPDAQRMESHLRRMLAERQGVAVELPQAANSTDKPDTSDQTVVNIDRQGELYVNSLPARESEVIDKVKNALEGKKEHIVYLKGDKEAQYGQIMKMMDALRAAQIESVALITERPNAGKGK